MVVGCTFAKSIFLNISKLFNITYATIVHRLDIVRHKLVERKIGEKKRYKQKDFLGWCSL
jgi:hypothetical protein